MPIPSMTSHNMHHHMHGAPAVPSSAQGDHDHGDMVADFRRRFWISVALTVPVLATSEMVQDWYPW